MKNKFITLLALSSVTIVSAQIGINTNNPQAALHVDGAKDNATSGVPTTSQQANDAVITSKGNLGIATVAPTEKLDIASGNARIREINANVGIGGTDRPVVADANGVLKTIGNGAYTLFHARLAANQNIPTITRTPLLFSAPIATSTIYSYNTETGILTFNQAGNYLVTLQASFTDIAAGTQLLMGVRDFPDTTYLGRGSHYNAVANSGTVGELMSYTTMLVIPTVGYQIRFVVAPNETATVLATEKGTTGSGNVTNVTVQKI